MAEITRSFDGIEDRNLFERGLKELGYAEVAPYTKRLEPFQYFKLKWWGTGKTATDFYRFGIKHWHPVGCPGIQMVFAESA